VRRIKGNHDFGTANLLQQLLARALGSGRFERHVHELRKRYAAKASAMTRAMRESFPQDVNWQEPSGGLYTWARVPGRMKTGMRSQLFRQAMAQHVIYVPGQLCYVDDPIRVQPDNEMRLSFGSAMEPSIRTGIRRLGEVIRNLESPM
jgi:2-aminoadipate transaminase